MANNIKIPAYPKDYRTSPVWTPPQSQDGTFGSINSDTSGARFDAQLPKGAHALQLYSKATPNGQKVTILLEELEIDYDAWHIDILKGEQFSSGFVAINPNAKIPALVDYQNDTPLAVFESGSILLYLADR